MGAAVSDPFPPFSIINANDNIFPSSFNKYPANQECGSLGGFSTVPVLP